jgi:hypothetical protein
MRVIRAKIIDGTHLELTQPIEAQPGEFVDLTIVDEEDIERDWREAGLARFLMYYSDSDSIYDEV